MPKSTEHDVHLAVQRAQRFDTRPASKIIHYPGRVHSCLHRIFQCREIDCVGIREVDIDRCCACGDWRRRSSRLGNCIASPYVDTAVPPNRETEYKPPLFPVLDDESAFLVWRESRVADTCQHG